MTGNAYVIYDDKNDSDLAARIYVVVTECSTVNGGSVTPPVTGYAISNTNSGAVSVTMDKNKVTIANVKVVDSNGANYNYGSATLNFKIEVRDGGYQEEVSFTAPAATANQSEYAGCMIDGDFTLPYELAAGNYRVTVTVSNNTIGTLTIGVGTATVA